jgi:hypothetical protein
MALFKQGDNVKIMPISEDIPGIVDDAHRDWPFPTGLNITETGLRLTATISHVVQGKILKDETESDSRYNIQIGKVKLAIPKKFKDHISLISQSGGYRRKRSGSRASRKSGRKSRKSKRRSSKKRSSRRSRN